MKTSYVFIYIMLTGPCCFHSLSAESYKHHKQHLLLSVSLVHSDDEHSRVWCAEGVWGRGEEGVPAFALAGGKKARQVYSYSSFHTLWPCILQTVEVGKTVCQCFKWFIGGCWLFNFLFYVCNLFFVLWEQFVMYCCPSWPGHFRKWESHWNFFFV